MPDDWLVSEEAVEACAQGLADHYACEESVVHYDANLFIIEATSGLERAATVQRAALRKVLEKARRGWQEIADRERDPNRVTVRERAEVAVSALTLVMLTLGLENDDA